MALQKPTYTGVNSIMDYYDAINADREFFYSVWHSQRDIAFQYVGNDAAKAREFLELNLEAMNQARNDSLLTIKFHPSKAVKPGDFVDGKTKVVCSSPVLVYENDGETVTGNTRYISSAASPNDAVSYKMYQAIAALEGLPDKVEQKYQQTISLFEARLKALEDDGGEDVETDVIDKAIGRISGILENPAIQGLLNSVIGRLFPQQQVINTHAISGVMDDEKIEVPPNMDMVNDAIQRLHLHCKIDSDLALLADLAETNPGQFKMLLGMLRSAK